MMPHPERAAEALLGSADGRVILESILAEMPLAHDDDKVLQPAQRDPGRIRPRSRASIGGREPNLTELGIFSAMWSEHCSYKSSKVLPQEPPDAGQERRPGAGRERRHPRHRRRPWSSSSRSSRTTIPPSSSPSRARRPGVGGILRDIFTMGARPDRPAGLAALRPARERPGTARSWRASSRASPPTATPSACPTVGGEVGLRRVLRPQPAGQRLLPGPGREGQDLLRQDRRASATPSSTSAPRRAATASTAPPWPRQEFGEDTEAQAAQRPGRRPVQGKAPARGLPRSHGPAASSSASRTWARPG